MQLSIFLAIGFITSFLTRYITSLKEKIKVLEHWLKSKDDLIDTLEKELAKAKKETTSEINTYYGGTNPND